MSANAFVVQCPSCFSAIPRNLAGGAAQSVAAEAPTVPAPVPAAPIAPSAAEATAPRAISFDDLPETAILGGGGGSISDADTLIEPLSIPPTKISGADPSATATVSPFEQTLPAHDPSPAHQPAPARQPAPAVEDSLFEARDTLIVAGGDTTRGDAPVAAAHRPNRQPIHSQDSISAETEAGSLDSAPTKAFSLASAKEVDLTGQTVGGYRVQRMLGAGGMGAVCLARQISLDRDVALKILPGRLAQNPEFLVRFTREALSAAQLCHHNIIQVYDVGSAGDVHFISMEYVRGDTLGNMVRRDGPLRVEDAASFVLQTARGLKYAHDLGIVHRDIKPDNLMVNEHGIVKIADMGLAKMRGVAEQTMRTGDSMPSLLARAKGDLTMVDVAMGTPAYMPPEQARDASSVDHRADQYALGCTLYYLVSGEPPYSGSTAFEIISQHMESPTPAIEEKVKNVPGELAAIVRRMLAKEPDERYPGMEAVIEDLEIVLGVEAEKGPYTPREHHLELLEREQIGYYGVPSLKWRRLAPMAFYALTVLAAVLCVFSKEFGLAGGFLGLMIMTPLASFILGGVQRKTYLFRRVRSVFFGMPLREWLGVTVGAAVAVALLYALGLLLWWAAFALVAAGLAAAYQLVIVRAVERQRAQPLGTIQEMLKHLRLKGLSEDAIQDFICRFSGEHWEEMFESLFGYEAMLEARARVAATDHLVKRKRYGVWREPILRWLDGVEDARRSAREKRHLAKVEARRLKAQGASERDAKRRAKVAAAKMHSELRSEDSRSVKAEARSQKEVLAPKPPRRLTPTDNVFRGARFVLGAVILLFFCSNLFSRIVPAAVQGVMQQVLSLPVPDPLLQMMLTFWGGAVSLLLIISAWSVHRLTGALVTAGAAAVVTANYLHPLVRASGLLDELSQYLQASTAIAGLGLAIAFFHKMAGRKF